MPPWHQQTYEISRHPWILGTTRTTIVSTTGYLLEKASYTGQSVLSRQAAAACSSEGQSVFAETRSPQGGAAPGGAIVMRAAQNLWKLCFQSKQPCAH